MPFFCGPIAADIFPRVNQVLNLQTRNGKTIRDVILREGVFQYDRRRLKLSDIISHLTNIAESSNLNVWRDSQRAGQEITRSAFARNTFSPFFPHNYLKDEPFGVDISPLAARIVDEPFAEAIKRVQKASV